MYQVCQQHIEKEKSVSLEEVTDYVRESASFGHILHAPLACNQQVCGTT